MVKRFPVLGFLKNQRFWIVVVLTLSTWLSYYPALPANFLNWDDNLYVTENQYIQSLGLEGLKNIFTVEIAGNYHPLTLISLALDLKIQGISPIPFHFTNLVLHTFCVFLTFIFIERISKGNVWVSFFTAIIFAIHPAHVEAVVWISERKDSLFLVFYLLGLIFYLDYLETKKWKTYLIVMFCYILSILSKPTAVPFPLVLFLLDFLTYRKDFKRAILEKIIPLGIAVGFGFVVIHYQTMSGAVGPNSGNLYPRFAIACYNFLDYFRLFFWPLNLSSSYPFTFSFANMPKIILYSPPFVILIFLIALWSLKKSRIPMFSLLFYSFTIFLTLQFLPVGWQMKADRYTYLPFTGLLFGLGMGIDYLFRKIYKEEFFRKMALAMITISIVIPFIVLSNLRTRIWQHNESLWSDAIDKYPINYMAYYNRGCHYLSENKNKLALRDFGISCEIQNDVFNSVYNLAYTFHILGYSENALKEINRAIALDSTKHSGYYLKAMILESQGKLEDFEFFIEKSLALKPDFYAALIARGNLYFSQKKYVLAFKDYDEAIKAGPLFPIGHYSKAVALLEMGKKTEAQKSLEEAKKLGFIFSEELEASFYE